jgi:thioredoxin 1
MNVTNDELKALVESGELVVVDFYANWCGPCKVLGPIYEDFAGNNPDVKIVKVNADEESDACVAYGVRGLPTILFIKDGEVKERMTGTQTLETLQTKLESHV